jgi:hypothetical protein
MVQLASLIVCPALREYLVMLGAASCGAAPEGLAGDPEHTSREHRHGVPIMARHLTELIGNVKLSELKVRDATSRWASWLSACRPGAR